MVEASHSLSLSRKKHITSLDRTAVATVLSRISMGGLDNEHVRSIAELSAAMSLKLFHFKSIVLTLSATHLNDVISSNTIML